MALGMKFVKENHATQHKADVINRLYNQQQHFDDDDKN